MTAALYRADGWSASSCQSRVEEIVVDQRTDLDQLNCGSTIDDLVIEHVTELGADDSEQRSKAFSPGTCNSPSGDPQLGSCVREYRPNPGFDRSHPFREVGNAEGDSKVIQVHMGRLLRGGSDLYLVASKGVSIPRHTPGVWGQSRRVGPLEPLRVRCRLGDDISRPPTDLRQRGGSKVLNRYKVVTLDEPSIRDVLIRSAGPGLDHASGGLSKAVKG
jgi:hypothetical protein